MPLTVTEMELIDVRVSARTTWYMVRISTTDGLVGFGECSDSLSDDQLAAEVDSLRGSVVGSELSTDFDGLGERWCSYRRASANPVTRFRRRTVLGALICACCDVLAQAAGLPLWRWLGGSERASVPLYANINRSAGDRRPEDFHRVARSAAADGFRSIKVAPFDGPLHSGRSLVETGLANTAAVRDAVGADVDVLVDVHLRLDEFEIASVLRPLEELRVGWLEDAVAVTDVAALRRLAGMTRLSLAGGERVTDSDELAAVAAAGVVSYVLLDPKWLGGPLRTREIVRRLDRVNLTYHNPTGPIGTAMCAHLSTLGNRFAPLEYAYGEDVDRVALTNGAERIVDGDLLMPSGPGLGVSLG